MVLKQYDSFRLNNFGGLTTPAQRSLLFSKHGKQKHLLDIRQMSVHDIVRITSASGSITLFEVVDPSTGTVLVHHVSSPYLAHKYFQGGRYLGRCFLGFLVEGGEDFCFLDARACFNRIWVIEKIEVLESHSRLLSGVRLINFF